ncbi:hypothetical protein AB0J43_09190, partial [Nonomuraea fuscirosea]
YVLVAAGGRAAWHALRGARGVGGAPARFVFEICGAPTPAGPRLGRMAGFFAWIHEQMHGSDLTDAAVQDGLTVLAALVHAARPLTVADLAAALGWPARRAAGALDAISRRPALSDPLAVARTGRGAYAVAPRPDRLSSAQRDALTAGARSLRDKPDEPLQS